MLLFTAGCTSQRLLYSQAGGQAQPIAADTVFTKLYIVRKDQSPVVLSAARMRDNAVVGTLDGQTHEIPLAEIDTIELREFSGPRTLGLVAATLLWGSLVMIDSGSTRQPQGDIVPGKLQGHGHGSADQR